MTVYHIVLAKIFPAADYKRRTESCYEASSLQKALVQINTPTVFPTPHVLRMLLKCKRGPDEYCMLGSWRLSAT